MKMLILLFVLLSPLYLSAETVNIHDRILTQEYYLKNYSILFGKPEFGRDENFKKALLDLDDKKKAELLTTITTLNSFIPGKALKPIIYYHSIDRDEERLKRAITFALMTKILVLRDYIDSPLSQKKNEALEVIKKLVKKSDLDYKNVFSQSLTRVKDIANIIAEFKDIETFTNALKETEILTYDVKANFSDISPHLLSYLGFIPGNQVEIVSKNDVSLERIQWFNDRVIFNGGSLDFNAPYIKMPTASDSSGNIVFQEDPIFIKIRDLIDAANDRILIDIFLFGGTLGATLSEYLLDQTLEKLKKNPDFKVIVIHDYATNYNMKDEMMPIFKYIKDRITAEEKLKDSVYLLQANIQRHPPGIPFGLTNLIPKTDEVFEEMEKRNTYYESKIDHSKVIAIDFNSDTPQAYFGSKNWTDHSGGYYYDDAIYVKGPAAALVAHSYYRDIEAALTENPQELKWFFYKEEGYDNKKYLPIRKRILEEFKVTRKEFPKAGEQPVRIAEADVDGTIKNFRNMLIDMIMKAQSHIYMEQLFIYDPYVVDALIKRKIEVPALKIQILADHNGNFGLNGLPNTLYMKEMIDAGIEVRARKTYGVTANFPNGETQEYHQENHRKITSVDGKVLIGGSSNINPDTLQGSFREFGAQIYDTNQIKGFESRFESAWNNVEETDEMDIENFQVKIGGKLLPKDISRLINAIGRMIFRSKDDLENRY
ncbi:MAG: hypothetical protein GY909_10190 [Oligoflexia bacterium]|nr:hypothetical protein [Oligoflexia bacterium]